MRRASRSSRAPAGYTASKIETASDLPVGQHESALRRALFVIDERHPKIRPPHVGSECDHPLKGPQELTLHAERDAARSTSPREVRRRANQLVESRIILEHQLQDTELLTRPTFDERRRVREREPDDPIVMI